MMFLSFLISWYWYHSMIGSVSSHKRGHQLMTSYLLLMCDLCSQYIMSPSLLTPWCQCYGIIAYIGVMLSLLALAETKRPVSL